MVNNLSIMTASFILERFIYLCFLLVVIDIADENGSLKSLSERPHEIFASEFLQGRGSFVLLKKTSKSERFSKPFFVKLVSESCLIA